MTPIQNVEELNEIVGGRAPEDPGGNGNPTYRATNPYAWDYEGYDPTHPH